jgi:hypothetical protein
MKDFLDFDLYPARYVRQSFNNGPGIGPRLGIQLYQGRKEFRSCAISLAAVD